MNDKILEVEKNSNRMKGIKINITGKTFYETSFHERGKC